MYARHSESVFRFYDSLESVRERISRNITDGENSVMRNDIAGRKYLSEYLVQLKLAVGIIEKIRLTGLMEVYRYIHLFISAVVFLPATHVTENQLYKSSSFVCV